jgi:hypothetical protein
MKCIFTLIVASLNFFNIFQLHADSYSCLLAATSLHNTIDLKSLSPGIYLYQIFEGGNRMMVGKMVKE